MKIGPKYKIGKRLGASVFEKCQTPKFQISEARTLKPRRRGRPRSDYGRQFLEKQKVRFAYGITERQLSNYITESKKKVSGKPAENLFKILESRLDNVVYRMSLAPTRQAARQMVSHGFFQVEGKRQTIPSFRVRKGDVVSIHQTKQSKGNFTSIEERLKDASVPQWISFDPKKKEGKIANDPIYEPTKMDFDFQQVLEFAGR